MKLLPPSDGEVESVSEWRLAVNQPRFVALGRAFWMAFSGLIPNRDSSASFAEPQAVILTGHMKGTKP
ncbi:hypothetical protein GCM10009093_11800 [Brevundimonas terrae]|uniref:Uncharacterized protein n=1 Tax=Brevundimonas terrae TaxID=363631 RepID=A0ABN0Y841_9CAUL